MKLNNETKIGIMVSVVVLLLAALTFKTADFDFNSKGYTVKAQFSDVDGVDTNAPVRLNGLEVGHVKDVEISYGDKTVMELTLWIQEKAKLTKGTQAYIKNMGLLGEKFVALSSGDAGGEPLSPGAIIVGEAPADLQKIMADGEVVAENLKEISTNLNERLTLNKAALDEIVANVKVASGNIAFVSSNLKERLSINDHLIDEAVANLHATSVNLEELSYDLRLNPWKLLYKTKEKRKKE